MCLLNMVQAMSHWTPKSQCLSSAQSEAISEVHPLWQKIQQPPVNTRVFEELTGGSQPNISRNHLLLCSDEAAVPDANVPALKADAASWRALSSHVPGMQHEMVQLADLILCTDEVMTVELNELLDREGASAVAHVSQLFSRIRSRHTTPAEADALRAAGTKFFEQYGVALADVGQQWELVMKWRSKRVAFAHPLLSAEGGIVKERLTVLATVTGRHQARICWGQVGCAGDGQGSKAAVG